MATLVTTAVPLFFVLQKVEDAAGKPIPEAPQNQQQDEPRDEPWDERLAEAAVADEPGRVFLTSMVACLFARSVYTDTRLAECLAAVGFDTLAGSIPEVAEHVRRLRWQARIATGFDPAALTIPKRFYDVRTWKGPVSREYLDALKQEYGRRIMELTAAGPQSSEGS